MSSIQKNVASQVITFCLINASTGAALTGATVVGFVAKDGTQASAGGTFTELANGQYKYAPTQAETNCTDFGLLCTATGAIPVNLDFHTDVVDGNGLLQVDLVDIAGSAVSTSSAQLGVNVVNINAQTATAAAGVTFPASIASPTNITAGTITTTTNLTNAPTAGDFTATMKTSIGTAVAASAVASVTGAVGSVTGNVGGNVTGSVASVVAAVSITSNRKKGSTATFEFLMQDATTGAPKTGLTVASTVSKDGGAPGATSNAVTEIGLGQYQLVLTATEMTANNIFIQMTSTGAITANLSIQTQL